jgi:formate hydrogenlyase subunit 6/NADH:ubiquinone oxidoreductase subunit I
LWIENSEFETNPGGATYKRVSIIFERFGSQFGFDMPKWQLVQGVKDNVSIQIYYLSGTGNSLHVAKELERRLPKVVLVPIVRALKGDKIETEAEVVGLVFPIHNLTMPIPVEQFLQRVDVGSAKYIFAVATRLCSDKVFLNMDKILEKQGRALDAYFSVEMPCTYIPIFKLPSQDTIAKMETELQKRLDEIQTIVANKQTHREKDSPLVFLLGHVLYPMITAFMFKVRFPDMARSFYADSRCTGCRVCEKVCLSDRIEIKNGKPEWIESIACVYCFACLHYCPVEAVQIRGRGTLTKGRYHHSEIKVADIVGQK